MQMKKGKTYMLVDPEEFVEDNELCNSYRDLKLEEEMMKRVLDLDKFSKYVPVVFHTKQSLLNVCKKFYMLGLRRELELHPKIPIEKGKY